MIKHYRASWFVAILLLAVPAGAAETTFAISHGPMLGPVSVDSVAIWVRTTTSGTVVFSIFDAASKEPVTSQEFETTADLDYTCIARFNGLEEDTQYRYVVRAGESTFEGTFTTQGPSLDQRPVRLVYGYGYKPGQETVEAGTSIFQKMAERNGDLVLFLGDFPYTATGARTQVEDGHKELRSIIGFRELTSSTPTGGIYDDHDFGPNDCDGDHENAAEALAAFKYYWPNPSYGEEENAGIYCSFTVGPVEFFLIDGRYQARKALGTMLGARQFEWLCQGLKVSRSRYKVLVSGTPFDRVKTDCWAGQEYVGERDRLFAFIREHEISGVLGISGDIHRSDIHKIPIGNDRFFYDFTSGALSRNHRVPPSESERAPTMIHSYGKAGDNDMFGEIEFYPPENGPPALVFRSFSAKNGMVYEHVLSPEDLNLD